MAIDSSKIRQIVSHENGIGLKMIIDLISFQRVLISEQCFWTLNNFLLGDRTFTPVMLQNGICKAIFITLEKIKTKSPELLAEMFWTLNYILDYDEMSVIEVLNQIPNVLQRLTIELEYEGDRL